MAALVCGDIRSMINLFAQYLVQKGPLVLLNAKLRLFSFCEFIRLFQVLSDLNGILLLLLDLELLLLLFKLLLDDILLNSILVFYDLLLRAQLALHSLLDSLIGQSNPLQVELALLHLVLARLHLTLLLHPLGFAQMRIVSPSGHSLSYLYLSLVVLQVEAIKPFLLLLFVVLSVDVLQLLFVSILKVVLQLNHIRDNGLLLHTLVLLFDLVLRLFELVVHDLGLKLRSSFDGWLAHVVDRAELNTPLHHIPGFEQPASLLIKSRIELSHLLRHVPVHQLVLDDDAGCFAFLYHFHLIWREFETIRQAKLTLFHL